MRTNISGKVPPLLSVGLGPVGLDPLIPLVSKPVKCYNRKTNSSWFTKMEDSLIVEAMLAFVEPPVLCVLVVRTLNSVSVSQIVPKVAIVSVSSANVGFLKPSSFAGWGSPPPAALGVIRP